MRIKKVGKAFVLYQTDGTKKRIIETDTDRKRLDVMKKFLSGEGGFRGAVPSFMLGKSVK